MSLKGDFWGAVLASAIVVGVPALVWGGSISARVESLETVRKEIREDLKEINRKLDKALEGQTKKAE